jgi:large subunit ribosomal protein L29
MPLRHAADFREMTDTDLALQIAEYRHELFNLRFQLATRKQKNHRRVRLVKRDIARILTVAHERELQALYDQAMAALGEAAGVEEVAPEAAAPVAEETTAPRRRGLFARRSEG